MSDKAKLDQIIGEAFVKATHIVLSARVTDKTSRRPSSLASKAWFNLDVEEVDSVRSALEQWRRDPSKPLAIQIYLHHPQTAGHPSASSPPTARPAKKPDAPPDVLLEQWVFDYRPPSPSASPHTSQHSTASGTSQLLARIRHEPPAVYKRLVVLMRSLYCLVRALPAHRLHRAAQRDGASMHLRYVVLAGTPAAPSHAGRMVAMAINAVETPYGSFGGSVRFQPHSVVTVLELSMGGRVHDAASDTVRLANGGLLLQHQQRHQQPTCTHVSMQDTPTIAPQASRPESSASVSSRHHATSERPPLAGSPTMGAYGAGLLRGVQQAGRALTRHASWAFGTPPTTSGSSPRHAPLRTTSSPAGEPSMHPDGIPLGPLSARGAAASRPAMARDGGRRRLEARSWGGAYGTPPKHPGSPLAHHQPPNVQQNIGSNKQQEAPRVPQPPSNPPLSSSTRQSSAPVCIPQRGRGRHAASTNDLWALGGGTAASPSPPTPHRGGAGWPASAPARGPAQGPPERARAAPVRQDPPPKPQGDSLWTSYTSSAGFPLSGSPQLPFACSPSAQSLASFSESGGPSSWAMPPQPSPPVASRDVAALRSKRSGMATGWSGRWGSSGGESQLLAAAGSSSGTPHTYRGAAPSPTEHGSPGSSFLSGSTPRAALLSGLGTPRAALLDPPGVAFGVVAVGGGRGGEAESESDCLPFVLDGDSQAAVDGPPLPPPDLMAGGVAEAAGEEPDAAVCAYLRLVQEVPPLEAGGVAGVDGGGGERLRCVTPLQAMERVAALRARLGAS